MLIRCGCRLLSCYVERHSQSDPRNNWKLGSLHVASYLGTSVTSTGLHNYRELKVLLADPLSHTKGHTNKNK